MLSLESISQKCKGSLPFYLWYWLPHSKQVAGSRISFGTFFFFSCYDHLTSVWVTRNVTWSRKQSYIFCCSGNGLLIIFHQPSSTFPTTILHLDWDSVLPLIGRGPSAFSICSHGRTFWSEGCLLSLESNKVCHFWILNTKQCLSNLEPCLTITWRAC